MLIKKIPIVVVTGPLGSGKSALIQALLQLEPWSMSALIINEAGDVNIDHQLFGQVTYASENVTAGCVCCDGAASLIDRLQDLFWLQLTKKIQPLQQVLIEASGVADPAQLHQILTSDAFIRSRFTTPVMIKTVDALQLDGPLSPASGLYQVLTKTDLLSAHAYATLVSSLCKTKLASGLEAGSVHTPLMPPSDEASAGFSLSKPELLHHLSQLGEHWLDAFPPLDPPPVYPGEAELSHRPCLTISLTPQEAHLLCDDDLEAVYAQQHTALVRLKAILTNPAGDQRVVDIVQGRLYPSRRLPGSEAGPAANHIVIFGQRAALLSFQIALRNRLDALLP